MNPGRAEGSDPRTQGQHMCLHMLRRVVRISGHGQGLAPALLGGMAISIAHVGHLGLQERKFLPRS